jgi:hypothetical protein
VSWASEDLRRGEHQGGEGLGAMEKIEIGREIGWYGWGRWLEAAMGETGARSSAREEMASEQGGSSLAERVPA